MSSDEVVLESGLIDTMVDLVVKNDEVETKIEQKTSYGLVLKELPKHLCYAFLGENSFKPIIYLQHLSDEIHEKLVEVLKRNIKAFVWCIDDIKGINPSICMHKILIEDDANPVVEHQRRLNPKMKEVVNRKF